MNRKKLILFYIKKQLGLCEIRMEKMVFIFGKLINPFTIENKKTHPINFRISKNQKQRIILTHVKGVLLLNII